MKTITLNPDNKTLTILGTWKFKELKKEIKRLIPKGENWDIIMGEQLFPLYIPYPVVTEPAPIQPYYCGPTCTGNVVFTTSENNNEIHVYESKNQS